MTKRALLIGSQTYGLTGPNSDVELMAETFESRGFEVAAHIDEAATRAGIIGAYEKLIADTPRGSTDPAVVYYSGHGGRTALDDWEELQREGRRSHLRYIVPFDMAASSESDFRGLLAEELSVLQSRLTGKTENVTTILDCCHSGTMSRDASVTPKAVPRDFPVAGALPLLDQLDVDAAPANLDTSNRLAVRVVACDPVQSAFERASVLGGWHGALTEQLVIALRELGGRPVSWRWLGDRIRTSITATLPMQRPEIEGPADRVPFSLATRRSPGAIPVRISDGGATIEPASLFGVSAGDSYRLVDEDEAEVARARITGVAGDRAELAVDKPAGTTLPGALMAVPVRTSSPRPVRLKVPASLSEKLGAKIEASPLLRVADESGAPAGASTADPPVAAIVGDDALSVLDGVGLAVNKDQLPSDDSGLGRAVAAAERIVKAERLRRLSSGASDGERVSLVRVELAAHDESGRTVRDRTGERLYPGERISVSITNTTNDTLYVGVFDIDLAYGITLLSRDEPSGWKLEKNDTKVAGGSDGVAMIWDETVPDTEERLETLLVVAATTPQEFLLLETPAGTRGRGALSELESLLAEAGTGTRAWPIGQDGRSSRYAVETIDFFLVPGTKPDLDEPPFAISELPHLSARTVQPRGAGDAPAKAAVRLVALKVRNNKALFKAAVRLDALVLTTGGDGQVLATPFTYRFPGIADGDLLPMDNLPLYLGEVRNFLDLAVWVNRDDTKGVDLAKLLEMAAEDPKTQAALTVLGGLVLVAPQVAVAVGAVAAVATVVRVASGLVQAAVGKEIGLYRTSFLAFERFGVGRQPSEGLRQAQGIEFAYEIIDISGRRGIDALVSAVNHDDG